MFHNKRIIITGGSSGLGKALAERLAGQGAHVALMARNQVKLDEAVAEIESHCNQGGSVQGFACDVADPQSVQGSVDAVADSIGAPEILINSAGILKEGYFETLPMETFGNVMNINYLGVIHSIRAVLPYFKNSREGRIVNIASLGGKMGSFGYTAYCSSKFALVGLTETLRAELKPQGITLHLVCPGEFESPMVEELNTYRTAENSVITQTVPVLPLDVVADQTLSGIVRGRYLIIPGRVSRIMELANRWFPFLTRTIVDHKIRKIYKGPQ